MGRGLLHSKHSKLSIWNTFCWKKSQEAKTENSKLWLRKGCTPVAGPQHKDEYHSLHAGTTTRVAQEFTDQKETKISGVCISMRSKINDITQTLKAVENEVPQAITNSVSQSSQTNLNTYHTEIEGGDRQSKAKMQWADYFHNVVNPYQVAIKGWPEHIPFTNLSKASNTLPDLKHLLDCWQTGSTAWKVLDDEELAQLRHEHDEKINSSQIIESHCRTRSDKGKKRKKYKSAETVESSDDEETQTHEPLTTSDSTIVSPSSSTPVSHVNTSNSAIMSSSSSTPVPNSQSGTNFFNDQSSTGLSGADLSNTMDMFPFDCDAALACLDELFNGHALGGTDFITPLP
ncbi:hypothetical protein EDB19DRAFT_1923946 [Suillus lakei]|nr:hypothetical protein EDB19DRAFT_1923946 [Suillus lakei]